MIEREENFQAPQIGGFLWDWSRRKSNALNHAESIQSELGRFTDQATTHLSPTWWVYGQPYFKGGCRSLGKSHALVQRKPRNCVPDFSLPLSWEVEDSASLCSKNTKPHPCILGLVLPPAVLVILGTTFSFSVSNFPRLKITGGSCSWLHHLWSWGRSHVSSNCVAQRSLCVFQRGSLSQGQTGRGSCGTDIDHLEASRGPATWHHLPSLFVPRDTHPLHPNQSPQRRKRRETSPTTPRRKGGSFCMKRAEIIFWKTPVF